MSKFLKNFPILVKPLWDIWYTDCILKLLTLTLQMEAAHSSKMLPTQCTSTWCQQSKIQSISHFHIMLLNFFACYRNNVRSRCKSENCSLSQLPVLHSTLGMCSTKFTLRMDYGIKWKGIKSYRTATLAFPKFNLESGNFTCVLLTTTTTTTSTFLAASATFLLDLLFSLIIVVVIQAS